MTTRMRPDALPVPPALILGRDADPVYGPEARTLIEGRVVLVTGAAGSIGSELVRQVSTLGAEVVYMLDHDECGLHALQLELRGDGLLDDDTTILADIRDRSAIRRLLRDVRPDIVYHAAAHKHLPLLERWPAEAVKTNVLGTENVVAGAIECGTERFINVSTDKAAAPTSVLGATKRLAETVVAGHASGRTRVGSVRFGNVLGSRGSFIHGVATQIRNGDPVTITDPAATRFFMSIPEAAGLVIEASVLASSGQTYVLDMGTPVRITDIVDRYVRLSGAPEPQIRITGLRPGEKLHEELSDAAEVNTPTSHPRISQTTSRTRPPDDLTAQITRLYHLTARGQTEELMRAVENLLPAGAAIPIAAEKAATGQRVARRRHVRVPALAT